MSKIKKKTKQNKTKTKTKTKTKQNKIKTKTKQQKTQKKTKQKTKKQKTTQTTTTTRHCCRHRRRTLPGWPQVDPRLTFDPLTKMEGLKLMLMYESYGHTMLPYHDKRNQLTFLAKLSYHLEMVKDDDIYLINSQTFNYHNFNTKIRPPQNWESCASQWQLFAVFGHYLW